MAPIAKISDYLENFISFKASKGMYKGEPTLADSSFVSLRLTANPKSAILIYSLSFSLKNMF